MCTIRPLFGVTSTISTLLQKKTLLKHEAEVTINELVTLIKQKRENAEENFKTIFQDAVSLHTSFGVTVSIPRLSKKQTHRNNVEASSPEEYYRRSIYVPMLDNVLMDINTRFNEKFFKKLFVNEILTSQVEKKTPGELKELGLRLGNILLPFIDTDTSENIISSVLLADY